MRILWFLAGLLLLANAAQAQNIFTDDVQMCSGHPWIDVRCNGALGDGSHDDTSAINTTLSTAITNAVPVYFPSGTYKVTSKITADYQGIAGNGLQVIAAGATLDGRTIASGNVLQFICSGGTVASPAVCNHLQISGSLTVAGNGLGYVVVIGKTDFSDQHNAARIEHLIATNNGGGGAIQANYLTDSDLWLSGSTAGGSSSVGAVALEQVQTSRIGGWGSASGASAPALLLETGASVGNNFTGFSYDPNTNTCVSITSSSATRNAWSAPYFPCATPVNAPTFPTQNIFLGPSFAGVNTGPISAGVAVVGRGSLNRYSAPAVASRTLLGSDDGTVFSAANATGPSTPFTASSLPLTLPSPSAVGSGWTAGFVSDNGKAVVLTAPSGAILIGNQQLATLTVAGSGPSSNFEVAELKSDGSNFRVTYISQAAALLNSSATAYPARWYFPGGPGYQLTSGDNGGAVGSAQTSAGLAVTLPQTTSGIATGWMVGLSATLGKPMTISVNGTNGGTLVGFNGDRIATALPIPDGITTWVQYDGSGLFRLIGATTMVVHVPNNAALTALPSGYARQIVRDGYYNAGDTLPYTYSASTSPCLLAGGDGGSQIPSADGKCWTANVSDCMSIAMFGASPTLSDNTAAVQAAIAAQAANGIPNACITVPLGKFKLASKISYTLPPGALTLKGAGKGLSFLTWTAANGGLAFAASDCSNSIHIERLSLTTQVAAGGTAFSHRGGCSNGIYQSTNTIVDVEDRGDDGPGQTDYWSTGFQFNNSSWWDIHRLSDDGPAGSGGYATASGGGVGISLIGASNPIGVVYNFVGLQSNLRSQSINYGPNIQGVTISGGSNFTGCYQGVLVPGGQGNQDAQLTISGSQFACSRAAVQDDTGVRSLNISNNLIIEAPNSFGLALNHYCFAQVYNNDFFPLTTNTSFGITWGSPDNSICPSGVSSEDGNIFENLQVGINIQSQANSLLIGHNEQFVANTVNIFNLVSDPFVQNIRILATDGYIQFNIVGANPQDGGLVQLGTTTPTSNNIVAGQYLFCWLNGTPAPLTGVFPVKRIPDNNNIVLSGTLYSNTLTGACFLSP